MESEELWLKQNFGKKQPFRVPDGYFEQFETQLMEHLPEKAGNAQVVKMGVWRKLRPVITAAACACIAVFGTFFYMNQTFNEAAPAPNPDAGQDMATAIYTSIDAAADYAMIDNDDIYALMADY